MPAHATHNVRPTDDLAAQFKRLNDRITSLERASSSGGVLPVNVARWEVGTYTPALTQCAVGTGGSAANTATYVYVGGPSVGDRGVMHLSGSIVFGTTGATLPQANPTIGLPSGFNLVTATTIRWLTATTTAAGGFQAAFVQVNPSSPNSVGIEPTGISGNVIVPTGMSPTVPATWAAGNGIRWSVTIQVVRV